MTRRPRNCWHLACCKCGRFRPRAAGAFILKRGVRLFMCAECKQGRIAA